MMVVKSHMIFMEDGSAHHIAFCIKIILKKHFEKNES